MDFPELYLDRNADIKTWEDHLPHILQDGKLMFLTWRLADSLPQTVLKDYVQKKELFILTHPLPWNEETTIEYHKTISNSIEKYLDNGYGSCLLSIPATRKILEDALLHYDGNRYSLHGYVIMPNHVHVLAHGFDEEDLLKLINSVRKYSAARINASSGRKGRLWNKEIFDRLIRNEKHYASVLNYIKLNPRYLHPNRYTLGGWRIEK